MEMMKCVKELQSFIYSKLNGTPPFLAANLIKRNIILSSKIY